MKRKVNLENVLVFVEYATMPIGSWPLPPDASFCAVLRRNFIWWFAFTHMIVSSLGWFYNIYLNIPDLDVVVPIVSELGPMYSVTTKMLICKVHGRRLQVGFQILALYGYKKKVEVTRNHFSGDCIDMLYPS